MLIIINFNVFIELYNSPKFYTFAKNFLNNEIYIKC